MLYMTKRDTSASYVDVGHVGVSGYVVDGCSDACVWLGFVCLRAISRRLTTLVGARKRPGLVRIIGF